MAAMCNGFVPLDIHQTEFVGNSLKLNGYYYNIQDNRYKVIYLFSNGVYRLVAQADAPGPNIDLIKFLDDKATVRFIGDKYMVRYDFGLFQVDDSAIIIEHWLSGVGTRYPKRRLQGTITNDSTFHITVKYGDELHGGNKPVNVVDEIYHFRRFSPKPDSVTKFIQ
jgi:hypothetical protein